MRRGPAMHGALLACGLAALAACHTLPDLGACGNGIVEQERGEACDDQGPSATCTMDCQLSCTSSAITSSYVVVRTDTSGNDFYCPDASYRCGTDGLCRAPSGLFAPPSASLAFDINGSPVLGDVNNDGLPDLVGTSTTNLYVRFSSTSTPLGDLLVQQAPFSDAPYAIFDLPATRPDAMRSGTMIAIPSEGIALLRSDGERFTPELDLAVKISGKVQGLVVRDPDPAIGDVPIEVADTSANATISVVRAPVGQPPIAMQVLPPCVGSGTQGWRTVGLRAAPDRRSFIVVTRRDAQPVAAQPWHVCRYTQSSTTWALDDLELAAPAPSSFALANLDADPCLELAVHGDGAQGLTMIDAAGSGCGFTPAIAALPSTSDKSELLGAGQIIPGGADTLVLTDGVYRSCTGPVECGARSTGTFVRVTGPALPTVWSAAAVVDLNGDGVPDVVAGRSRDIGAGAMPIPEPDVDVVRGGATPNVYRANTSEPVTNLVTGDFDGDRLGDVAMVESGPQGSRVTVLFGTKEATVGAPIAMSSFVDRLQIDRVTEVHWLPSTRGSDGLDDLIVLSTNEMITPPTTSIGLLIGDAARVMTTPQFPATTGPDVRPLGAVAAGSFGSDNLEILALTGMQAQRYNVMENQWETQPVNLGVQLDQPVAALHDGSSRTLGAARGTGDRDVVVFSLRDAFTMCQVTAAAPPRALRGIDIDGDGVDELAVFTGNGAGAQGLQLFRATGCPLEPLLGDVLADDQVTCIDVANAGNRLVAICRSGGAPNASDVYTIENVDGKAVRTKAPIATIDGDANFVTAGDYDGDGVPDIAIGVHHGSSVGIRLLRQCPAHDTRACR